MLANNTYFDVPFNLPFNVIYMPDTMAYILVEASVSSQVRVSLYLNETTITASTTLSANE